MRPDNPMRYPCECARELPASDYTVTAYVHGFARVECTRASTGIVGELGIRLWACVAFPRHQKRDKIDSSSR